MVIFRFYNPASLPLAFETIFPIVIFHGNKVLAIR